MYITGFNKYLFLFLMLFSLTLSSALKLNFESNDVEGFINQRFKYYSNFSMEEKDTFCANNDRISCIFIFFENLRNKEYSADALIIDIENYSFTARDKDIALFLLLKERWLEVSSDKILSIISGVSDQMKKKFNPIYLRKLYSEKKYKEFYLRFTPIRDQSLTFHYISYLVKKNPGKAFRFARDLEYSFPEEFYTKLKVLFDKYEKSLKRRSLFKEYRVWLLDYNYRKVRYKVLINNANNWFNTRRPRNVYDWRAALYKAMAYTKRREHSKAVATYKKIEKKISKFELSDSEIYKYYRWFGYSYAALGKNDEAIEIFLSGYQKFIRKAKGADFLYHGADMARLDLDYDKARELYLQMKNEFPENKKTNLINFLLFWIDYKEAKYDSAGSVLDEIMIKNLPATYSYRRAKYWKARVLEKFGKKEASIKIFNYVVKSSGATFYGALAASRLKALGHKLPELNKNSNSLNFLADNSLKNEQTDWITALYSIKEYSMARKLLYMSGRKIKNEAPEMDKLVISFVAKEIGLYSYASSVLKTIPNLSEKTQSYIKLQYPINFEEEIASHAHFYSVPSLFVFSIARQESLFNVKAISSSYALGLLQLLPTTAQLLANKEKYGKVTPRNLKKPLTNIRFGIKFLGILLKKFNGSIPLASGGYNAGPGKIVKWIKNKPTMEIDEFIEDIPIFQTRNYVKKVMRNFAMYHYLYEGTVYSDLKFKTAK